MKRLIALCAVALTGCATQQDIALMPPEQLCYLANGGGAGFTPSSDFWQGLRDRGIDCAPYLPYIAARKQAEAQGLANAAASWNALQQQQTIQRQQQMLIQQQQQQTNRTTTCRQVTPAYGAPYLVCN